MTNSILNSYKQTFSNIPDRLLNLALSYSSFNTLLALQQVNKRSNKAAKDVLDRCYKNPLDLASTACSDLLTAAYHFVLERKQNLPENLARVSRVTILQSYLFLNPISFRPISDADLGILKTSFALETDSYVPKFKLAQQLILQAIRSPRLYWDISLATDLLHEVDFHSCLLDKTFKEDDKIFKIRIVITMPEESATKLLFQAKEIDSPSAADKENAYTSRDALAHEIHQTYAASTLTALSQTKNIDFSGGEKEQLIDYTGKTQLERAITEAILISTLQRFGAKMHYSTRDGQTTTFE